MAEKKYGRTGRAGDRRAKVRSLVLCGLGLDPACRRCCGAGVCRALLLRCFKLSGRDKGSVCVCGRCRLLLRHHFRHCPAAAVQAAGLCARRTDRFARGYLFRADEGRGKKIPVCEVLDVRMLGADGVLMTGYNYGTDQPAFDHGRIRLCLKNGESAETFEVRHVAETSQRLKEIVAQQRK